MNLIPNIIGGLAALVVLVYLGYALAHPERF
ncbi:potassium-transporting ATPase subunit F [Arsenicicoccus dermatophilus]|nr:potassium-transporting ATPase subunit F [Arsenicicoccus dermatophilus]MCH8611533.1 potassium-transporting ATPase subunit F [Arsenicicoccus dermatophilus]